MAQRTHRVNKYLPPSAAEAIAAIGVLAIFVACALCFPHTAPGSRLWDLIEAYYPGGPEGFDWLRRTVLKPVMAVHALEPLWFSFARLQRHGVEAGSALWCKWMATCLLEGFPSILRFDRMVARQKAAAGSKRP